MKRNLSWQQERAKETPKLLGSTDMKTLAMPPRGEPRQDSKKAPVVCGICQSAFPVRAGLTPQSGWHGKDGLGGNLRPPFLTWGGSKLGVKVQDITG